VPQPEFTEGADNEEYSKAVNAWRDDYEKRIASEASQVLNTEQLTAYNEIQQWQKEMRDQLPPGFRRVRGYGGGPNTMMYSTAVSAGAVAVTAVGEAPSPAPAQKKP